MYYGYTRQEQQGLSTTLSTCLNTLSSIRPLGNCLCLWKLLNIKGCFVQKDLIKIIKSCYYSFCVAQELFFWLCSGMCTAKKKLQAMNYLTCRSDYSLGLAGGYTLAARVDLQLWPTITGYSWLQWRCHDLKYNGLDMTDLVLTYN